jgi:hypothetical protein
MVIPQRTKLFIRVYGVDMCWALVAEEPHRSTILSLEHCLLFTKER